MHKDSDMCVGYLFVDIQISEVSHRFFESGGVGGERTRCEIGDIVREHYNATCETVKAVDPNHLILGDRFSGNKGIMDRVLDAMKDHVDVLSVLGISVSRVRSRRCVW